MIQRLFGRSRDSQSHVYFGISERGMVVRTQNDEVHQALKNFDVVHSF